MILVNFLFEWEMRSIKVIGVISMLKRWWEPIRANGQGNSCEWLTFTDFLKIICRSKLIFSTKIVKHFGEFKKFDISLSCMVRVKNMMKGLCVFGRPATNFAAFELILSQKSSEINLKNSKLHKSRVDFAKIFGADKVPQNKFINISKNSR